MDNVIDQIFINVLVSFSLYLLIATSFAFIYYPTKTLHVAHAGILTLGAYFLFLFSNTLQLPIALSLGFSLMLSILTGATMEFFILRKMRERKAHPQSSLIASLGLYVLVQNVVSLCFGDEPKNLKSKVEVGLRIFDGYISSNKIVLIGVSISLFLIAQTLIKYSKIGKLIRAVNSNPELCNYFGIDSNRVILASVALGSGLGAIAGMLSATDTNFTPIFGFKLLLYGVISLIIGGVGSFRGVVLGSLLLATVQNLAAYYIDTKWMDAVTYLILILFLLWKPLGFSGKRLKKVEI